MKYKINKSDIFTFLKAESIIEEINDNKIVVYETEKDAKLEKVIVKELNENSKYWTIDTESKILSPEGRKVEKVIFEQTDSGVLNVIMVELKSGNVSNEARVIKKFSNSLSWVYLLLNLLHEEQSIQVFGILISQDKTCIWNKKDTLNILSSTRIPYTKRSFFTEESEIEIEFSKLIS